MATTTRTLREDVDAHAVHFYGADGELFAAVGDYLGNALRDGAPIVVIATSSHSEGLRAHIRARGVDIDHAVARGDARFLDAEETLARFMTEGRPDRARFRFHVKPHVERADGRTVVAYGEMVDVLWGAGNAPAALELEELWNELREETSFALLCAYAQTGDAGAHRVICDAHDVVHLRAADEGSLLAEVAHRKEVERQLRRALRDIRLRDERHTDLVENAAMAMHIVDGDGRIVWLNAAELELLGYEREELIGRPIRDIHVDEGVLDEILRKLGRGEGLHDQPARLRRKDGRVIDVRITSNARMVDGSLAGTRCFTRDITTERAATVRLERIARVTARLAKAVAPEDVLTAIVEDCRSTLGALSAGLWLVDEDRAAVSMRRSDGYVTETAASLSGVPLERARFPALDAILDGAPIWIDRRSDLVAAYPHLEKLISNPGDFRTVCLPMTARGAAFGCLAFTFGDGPPLEQQDRDFLLVVADYAAHALERLRLLEAEQRRSDRARLLARATHAFADSGPDATTLLDSIGKELTAELAESCGILLVDSAAGVLRLAAASDRDPAGLAALRPIMEASPPRIGEGVAGTVAVTGRTVLLPTFDPTSLLKPGVDPAVVRWLPRSLVTVPLKVTGDTIGVLTVTRRTLPRFTSDDARLLEEIAAGAAAAIERSRLHDANRRSHEREQLLHRVAGAANRAETIEAVLDASLDAIASLGVERSAVLAYDADGVMRFRAWRMLSDEYRRAVEGHSPWQRGQGRYEPLVVADACNDPAWAAYAETFRKEGIGALAFIPLTASGELIGKFMLYWPSPRSVSPVQEVATAAAIASHTAAALVRFAAVAELRQTVQFNELFTGMLGHDLRNPLSAMMSGTHLALARGGELVAKPLARVLSSGERMSRMIDQLLDFTRVRIGGGIPIRARRCDVTELLRKIVDEHEDGPIAVSFEHSGPLKGVWDEDRLAQVFSNLIGNAVQHGVADAGVRVRVTELAPDRVRIDVENGGVIDDELLPRLFEPLAGGKHRKRDGSRGLGLGLHITQRLVAAHGGDIRVTSTAADGTRFTVELPRGASRDVVLLVDDDEDIRETLREILEEEGLEVVAVASGAPALEHLERCLPSVVLLDLMMPGIDGSEVYARMKADARWRDIPVIISTSAPDLAPEGSLVMKKPLDVARLLNAVRAAAENSVARSA